MRNKSILSFMLSLVLLSSVFALGCTKTVIVSEEQIAKQEDSTISRYSNNIYYFPYVGKNFATALSRFLDRHGDLEVVSISSDGAYKWADGFVVVMRPKVKPLDKPAVCGTIKAETENERSK